MKNGLYILICSSKTTVSVTMLDNLEHLSWSYIHDYARVVYSDYDNASLNFPAKKGKYGDIIYYGYDIYVYLNNRWTNKYTCLYIWDVDPNTGYFIFSDYWQKCHIDDLTFKHKPYLNELLNNIEWKITGKRMILFTFAYIKGLKCTIYGGGGLRYQNLEKNINAFKRLLQSSDQISGNYYTTSAYNQRGIPLTESPLSMYVVVNID